MISSIKRSCKNKGLLSIKIIFGITVVLVIIAVTIFESLYFSNRSYSKSITLLPYLVDSSHVALVFQNTLGDFNQPKISELDKTDLYLLIRLKNNGNRVAWGALKCSINGREFNDVTIFPLSANMDNKINYVVPLGGAILPNLGDYPSIKLSWSKLLAK